MWDGIFEIQRGEAESLVIMGTCAIESIIRKLVGETLLFRSSPDHLEKSP